MTTDLEKKFFDTFGIKPEKTRHSCNSFWEKGIEDCPLKKCDICTHKHETLEVYPQITDRILLKLVLIMNPWGAPIGANIEEAEKHVLELCMQRSSEIKQQVQSLFKE